MKTKLSITKRTIAREILIFFSGAIIMIALWGIALCINAYDDHRVTILLSKQETLKEEIKKLPTEVVCEPAKENIIGYNTNGTKKPLVTDPAILAQLNSSENDGDLSLDQFPGLAQNKSSTEISGGKKPVEMTEYTAESKIKIAMVNKEMDANADKISTITNRKFDTEPPYHFLLECYLWIFMILYISRACVWSIWWAIKNLKIPTEVHNGENIAQ